jgi:hypothetical protein
MDGSGLSFRYITLPCQTEKGVLEELTHISDTYVYNHFLELLSLGEAGIDIQDAINRLYDELIKLLHNCSRRMRGMKDLKRKHLQPLLTQIRESPEICRK